MSVSCSSICIQYKALMPQHIGRYESGQKRCNSCDVFLIWDGRYCPCCGDKLRLSPRSSKYKQKYLKSRSEQKEIIPNGM
jgi:rRNA maturation endonuclease Nob1